MNRVAIFAHYDKNNKIEDYVIYYLKELKKVVKDIIFVSDSNISNEELEKISKIVTHKITEKHGEYDFGSYKKGYFYLLENNLINNYDELIFANDSCFGPLYSFEKIFEKMNEKSCDFWGTNENKFEYAPHIQSFFMVFKKEIFTSEIFKEFIGKIKKEENKENVIINYEVGLSQTLLKNGFNYTSINSCPIKRKVTQDLFNEKEEILIKKCIFDKLYIHTKKLLSNKINKALAIDFPIQLIENYNNKKSFKNLKYNIKVVLKILKYTVIGKKVDMSKYFTFQNKKGTKHIIICFFGIQLKIKRKLSTQKRKKDYYIHLEKSLNDKTCFIQNSNKPIDNTKNNTRLIAFYLPQYHTFKENDDWHGKGFTEWTNVTKGKPMYEGHYQPQLPIDVGFYNLSTDETMYRQIELAKQYGIYGFCFYYYWFSGKRLMEKPIFNFLNNKELDIPFCLCWANENWSKRWDGGNNEVLIEQTLNDGDAEKFIEDIAKFFKDPRYIKIENNPVLIIYKLSIFEKEKLKKFIDVLKTEIKKHGFEDIYIIRANTADENIKEYGINATVEFPPHKMDKIGFREIAGYVNPKFKGGIFNIENFIKNKKFITKTNETTFKTCFPNWDNTARREYNSYIYESTPELYSLWLKELIKWTKQNNSKDKQYVFINAWNEWAEGAHLEPCNKYGYAYLEATKKALEEENNAI